MRDDKGKFIKGSTPYNRKTGRYRKCLKCNKQVYVTPANEKLGYDQYCSRGCRIQFLYINCLICKKEIIVTKSLLNKGKKYCSQACYTKAQLKPIKPIYKNCLNCKIYFNARKGSHVNKFYCSPGCRGQYKSLTSSISKTCLNCNKIFILPKHIPNKYCSHKCAMTHIFITMRGENHPHFRKENITYSSIHSYTLKTYGTAPCCLINDETCSSNIEWANINHKNKNEKFDKSEVTDFIPLCESHHTKFDRKKL